MFVHKDLGLIALNFLRIFWISLKIPSLENFPIYPAEIIEVRRKLSRVQVCVTIRKNERNSEFFQSVLKRIQELRSLHSDAS